MPPIFEIDALLGPEGSKWPRMVMVYPAGYVRCPCSMKFPPYNYFFHLEYEAPPRQAASESYFDTRKPAL